LLLLLLLRLLPLPQLLLLLLLLLFVAAIAAVAATPSVATATATAATSCIVAVVTIVLLPQTGFLSRISINSGFLPETGFILFPTCSLLELNSRLRLHFTSLTALLLLLLMLFLQQPLMPMLLVFLPATYRCTRNNPARTTLATKPPLASAFTVRFGRTPKLAS